MAQKQWEYTRYKVYLYIGDSLSATVKKRTITTTECAIDLKYSNLAFLCLLIKWNVFCTSREGKSFDWNVVALPLRFPPYGVVTRNVVFVHLQHVSQKTWISIKYKPQEGDKETLERNISPVQACWLSPSIFGYLSAGTTSYRRGHKNSKTQRKDKRRMWHSNFHFRSKYSPTIFTASS